MSEKLLYYPVLPEEKELGSQRSDYVKQWIEQDLKPNGLITSNEEEANVYLVASGDGGMTKATQEKSRLKKIFFGVNCGTLGFLMNQISKSSQIPRYKSELNLVTLNMIEGVFIKSDNQEIKSYAFNEILCGGNIADYITFEIKGSLTHFRNRVVKGNGIIVSTPQGTTGFALHAKGSSAVLPLDTKAWYMAGVATGSYPCGVVSPQEICIKVDSRYSVNGYADGYGYEVKDIKEIKIRPTNEQVMLGFVKGIDFESRRKILVEQVELGQ